MRSTSVASGWLKLLALAVMLAVGLVSLSPPREVVGSPAPEVTPRFTPERNRVSTTEKDIPSSWDVEAGTNIRWSIPLGSKAYGGPVIAGGKIFVGTNNDMPRNPKIQGDRGIVMCFRESDGKLLWQAVHDKLPQGRVNDWPREGIASSPAVVGNRLYYVSNRCEVVCADTEGFLDGKNDGVQDETRRGKTDADIIWRIDMMKELNVFPHNLAVCSPLVVEDTLFVVTGNGVDEGHIRIPQPDAPSFLAIDRRTGKVLWKDNSPGRNIMHAQWSNPVYAAPRGGPPQVIFPGGDGWLYAFNPANGELIWKFDCNPKKSVYILGGKGTKSDFVATPVVWENRLYIGVGQDPEHNTGVGHLWCIDITKKPTSRDRDLSPVNDCFDPKDPVNRDSGLVWHYGGETTPGQYRRSYWFGRTLSTCAVHDGLLFVSEYDGHVHCFDARTGEHYWEHDMRADTWASPYWVDGKVFIGNEAGEVYVFAPSRQKQILGIVEMEIGSVIRWSYTAANGVLYLISQNPCRLYAIGKK